jgi:enamine deaminase RidA (YjgF/YER057c/UK114 family)
MTEINERRRFVTGTIAGLAGGAFAAMSAESGQAAEVTNATRVGLNPSTAPSADSGYTPGIVATGNKVVFVSGQGPKDYDADMEIQMRQTFDRIEEVLREAGAGWKNVVILRSYFVHLHRDLPVYRKIRKEYLEKPYPASTAVGTPELAIPGLEIEIEAVAVI